MKLTDEQKNRIEDSWGDWENVHGLDDKFVKERLKPLDDKYLKERLKPLDDKYLKERLKPLDDKFVKELNDITAGATFWYA